MTNSQPVIPKNAFLILNGADIIPLEKDIVNIGRMEDNDIVIPNAHISRYHAQIRGLEGKYILIDLQSTSGTSVNGQVIQKKLLAPGDVIMIAGIPLIYGQTSGPEKFGPSNPAQPAKKTPPRPGVTQEVDLSELDNIIDIMDLSEDHSEPED